MIQTSKRVLALGMMLSAAGLLVDSQPSLGRAASIRPIAISVSKSRSGGERADTFDLLRELGKPHSISMKFPHVYRVNLKAGQFLRLIVQQNGIDVRLTVYDPDTKRLFTVDSANSDRGPEPVLLVAKSSGQYEVAVSTSAPPRDGVYYFIETIEIRQARERDRKKSSALQAYYKARERSHSDGYSDQAVKDFEMAARLLDESESPENLRADAWIDLGRAYSARKQWPESVTAFRRAAGLSHRTGNKGREALALNEIGRGEESLAKMPDALKHYKQAVALAHSAKSETTEASALTNLGMYYAERAGYLEAENYLGEALSLWRKALDQEGEAKALNGIGEEYIRMGDTEKALSVYQSVLRELKLPPLRYAVTLTQIGNAYNEAGRPDASLRYFKEAYDIQKKGGDPGNVASTLVGFGVAYSGVHKFGDALDAYQRALRIYESERDLRNQASVLLNMGWALGGLKRYAEARESFRRSLSLARDLDYPVWQAGSLLGSAWLEKQRGNLDEAQREAEQARDIIETLRSNAGNQEMQQLFFSVKQDTYAILIGILMDRYERRRDPTLLAEAIQVSESTRSRSLLDALGKRNHSSAGHPAPVVTVSEIQRLLGPDTALLEYALGRTQSYLFFITSNEVSCFTLPAQEEIEALVRAAYNSLSRSYLPEERAKSIARSRKLSDVLLKPLVGRLEKKRLLIVASGGLQSIPFGGLPDPDVPLNLAAPQSWPQPLLLWHEVLAEPSASVLAQVRRIHATRAPAEDLLAVLADGVFSPKDERLPRTGLRLEVGSSSILGALPRLPASRDEADAISSGLPKGRVFRAFGFDANRKLLTSGKLTAYRILHLATHTFSVPQHPESAALLLSSFDHQGHAIDGLLRVKDISALEIRSDLVVLSSCNSAEGKNVPGEGVVGLPQAFLSAGASGVVTTVWDIEDQRASELMKSFYTNLLMEGMPLSGALQSAQIKMMSDKRWRAPWFWAGFVAQGEWASEFSLNKNQPTVSSQSGAPKNPAMKKKSPPSRFHY